MNLSPLELELLVVIKEQEDARKAEETYRWKEIGQYPNIPVTPEIREEWLAELDKITDRQYKARKSAQEVLEKYNEC